MANGKTTPIFTLAPAVVLSPSASARNVIIASTDITPLVVKGSASQTAPLQDWKNSANLSLFSVTPNPVVSNTVGLRLNSTVAGSPFVINASGGTHGATFDPMLVYGYNNLGNGIRVNTSDAAGSWQVEGNYENTRGASTVYDIETSFNVISTSGAKLRRLFGIYVNRDDPDTYAAMTFYINNSVNGRVEIVDGANVSTRLYDFRYDGFMAIQTASPNIELNQVGTSNGIKWMRSNAGNFQVMDNAYANAVLSITDAGVGTFRLSDATTNAVATGVIASHRTSGTIAAGFGTAVEIRGNSSTTVDISLGRILAEWVDPTHASRKARTRITAYDTAEREGLRIEASGAAPMVGLYGAAAVVRATTSGSASTFAANTSGVANDTATWDGYTMGQVVKALRDIGVLI